MGLEAGSFVDDLVANNPLGTDDNSVGDDHLRLIKKVLKATFIGATRAFHFPSAPDTKVGAYTIALTDENAFMRADVSSGAFTLTLPLGSSVFAGFEVTVMKVDSGSNEVTTAGAAAETINGSSTDTIATQYIAKTYIWDSEEWKIKSESSQVVAATDTTLLASTGDMKVWPTATPPTGWLECDASAVSRTTYSDLFDLIGATFGVGDGSTTFNLPDFRGRVPVGVGTGDASNATAFALADKDGDEVHLLVSSESGVPVHTHPNGSSLATHEAGGTSATTGSANSGDNAAADAASAHNNLQPSLGVHIIIKT